MTRTISGFFFACLVLCGSAAAQQARYDDVVRNLRNPDPKVRFSAIRLLRESKYPDAVGPIAALVTDPVDQIQLEAIAAELSLFLVEEIPERKRVALLVEVRNPAQAATAFEAGPLAVWPHPVPPELVHGLLQAVDDENQKVRVEAIYTLGTIVRPPLADESVPQLIKALDHYDPAIRAAAARVIGRLGVKGAGDALINAMNDSNSGVRYAAMRALGAIRDDRAVQALTEQFNFYGKGRARGPHWMRSRGSQTRPACRCSRRGCRTRIRSSAGRLPTVSAAWATSQSSRRSRLAPGTTPRRWCEWRWPSRCRSSDRTTFRGSWNP